MTSGDPDEDDNIDNFDEKMNEDQNNFHVEVTESGSDYPIDEVESTGEDAIRIVVDADGDQITQELSPEEAREYRDAFDVDSVSQFEGEQVIVMTDRESGERYIDGPSTFSE